MRRSVVFSFIPATAAGFLLTAALLPLRNRAAAPAPRTSLAAAQAEVPALPSKASGIGDMESLSALIVDDDHYATQANLWKALQSMDASRVGKLARELSLITRGDYSRESAAQAVWERWVELDPEAAGLFLPSITNGQVKIYAGYSLISRFALTDPARVERLITSVSGDFSFDAANMKENLLYRIAQERPEEAARKLGEPFYKGSSSERFIAELWSERDPRAALEWVRTLSPDRGRNAALAAVLRAQVRKDPAAALELVNSAPKDQQSSLSGSLAEGWVKVDDAGALAWVRSLADPEQRGQAWEGYLRTKTREDSAKAAEILKTLPEAEREAMRYRVLETLQDSPFPRLYGEGNISDPLDLLRDAPPGAMLEAAKVMKIMASLDGREQRGALDWALSLGRDDAALAAVGSIVSRAPDKDIPAAAQKIGTLENTERRLPIQEKLAARWAGTDFPAAEAWMRTLPPEDQGGVREVMIQAGKPEMAAPLLFEVLQGNPAAADDPAWRRSVTSLYNSWAWQDGPAAAASALTIPPGENRTEALRQVKGRWLQRDMPAALEWLETLAPDDLAVLENQP